MLCQFSDGDGRTTLKDHVDVPDVYPAGRLDRDSEGLVVLTDDGRVQDRLAHPRFVKEKGYWVQVERIPDDAALEGLRRGVDIKGGRTRPARIRRIEPPDGLWERNPPVRFRKSVPDCWLELFITEGMNRQVRRMTAAVGHPTLRLVRFQVGPYRLDGLAPGQWRAAEPPQVEPGSGGAPGRGRRDRMRRGRRGR